MLNKYLLNIWIFTIPSHNSFGNVLVSNFVYFLSYVNCRPSIPVGPSASGGAPPVRAAFGEGPAWLRAPFLPSFPPWGGCPRALPSTWGKNLAPFPGQARAALLCPRAWSGHTAADATPWRLLPRARGPPALFPPPPCLAFRREQPAGGTATRANNQSEGEMT